VRARRGSCASTTASSLASAQAVHGLRRMRILVPTDSISVDKHAVIASESCIGCGECVAACQEGAVAFDWSVNGRELQERVVEHAAAWSGTTSSTWDASPAR